MCKHVAGGCASMLPQENFRIRCSVVVSEATFGPKNTAKIFFSVPQGYNRLGEYENWCSLSSDNSQHSDSCKVIILFVKLQSHGL